MRVARKFCLRITSSVPALLRDRCGVAATEFALIVPIMLGVFLAAVELSRAVTVFRRVHEIASSTADLVARSEKNISTADVSDIMQVAGFLMGEYSTTPLTVAVRNVTSAVDDAANTKESWKCTNPTASGGSANCTCPNTAYALPAAGLVEVNDSVVVTEVSYGYQPLFADLIIGSAALGDGGAFRMRGLAYFKPRGQAAKLNFPDGATC
ncbi:MAG: TadE/TadG family type IV pilus assembly protein [Hyphomicrobiaceae bacterium]